MVTQLPTYPTTAPATALGMNEIIGVLKEVYDGQKVIKMAYTKNPFFAQVEKKPDVGGKLYPLPIIVDSNANATNTFSYALANTTPMQIKEFMVPNVTGYQVAQITRQAMRQAAYGDGSFLDGTKATIDQAIIGATNLLASGLARDGTGSIGQIATNGITSGVITLADPNSIVQFQVGAVLEARSTSGGTVVSGGALGYVISRNAAGGTLTVSATAGGSAGTPTNWVAGNYLNVQGTSNLQVLGVAAWLNAQNVLSNDNFCNVNRSSDVTRLAGVYYDGSAQSIEEALTDASTLVFREGGTPDVAFMSPQSYSAFQKALGARAVYTEWEGPAEIMYKGIVINGAAGEIRVMADRNLPGYTCHLLTMSTWVLLSTDDAPNIFDYDDDTQMLRMGSYDSAELRVGWYANLGCRAPGWNALVKLSS